MPRTTFRSETDGYAFGNSWMLDQSELDWVRKVVSDAVAAVEIVLSPIITAALGPVLAFELGVPGFGFLLAHETVKKANEAVVSAILDNTKDNTQGYCGGMAFSALDYFLKGWVIPRGKNEYDQPNDTTPSGAILRKYIWDRLMDSVRDNMGTFLQWTAVLHFSQGPGAAW